MENDRQSSLRAALVVVSFFALSAAFYLPALRSFFHCDDFWLLDAVRRDGPFGVWSNRGSPFLRPIISLSLYLDWRLWGLNPFGYHAANVVAHTINAVCVTALFPLLIRVCGSSRNIAATSGGPILTGLLFLLQPTHPEAVSWISGRTDVYATLFCLMSLYFYLRHKVSPGHLWQKGAWALFALSLLSKESALLFPLVIVALEVSRLRALDKGVGVHELVRIVSMNAWPFFGIVAIYIILRVIILGHLVGGYGAVHTTFNVGSLSQSAIWFLCSAILPLMSRWSYCFAALSLLAIAFVLRLRGKVQPDPILGFLFVAFYLASVPALNLGGGPAPDGMSGRLVYLASAFAALALIPLVDYLVPNRLISRGTLMVLAGVFGVQLYLLNLTWLRAGHIAQESIKALASSVRKGPVVVLAAPDTLYPAFILRNGLPEAIRLYYPDADTNVEVVSSVFLYRPIDGVTMRSTSINESPGKRSLDLFGADPPGRSIPLGFTPGAMSGREYEARFVSRNRLQVILPDRSDTRTEYFVFYGGRLSPLSSVPVKPASNL